MSADVRDAFHEAGHAVVAVLYKVSFVYVSLKIKKGLHAGQSMTWTEGVVYPEEDESIRKASLLRGEITDPELYVSLAGMLAESIHLGAYDDECRKGGAFDMHNLCVAMAVRLGCGPEAVAARAEWKALTEPAITACLKLLEAHWNAVDRVATLLLQRRKLSWDSALAIVAEYR